MLFMVIERFKNADPTPIGKRFKQKGRMLPEGVVYHSSWVDSVGSRCFQVMEAPQPELLNAWVSRWNDLIDFEIVPVLTSGEFWAERQPNSRADHVATSRKSHPPSNISAGPKKP
jgi:hypothetical protein